MMKLQNRFAEALQTMGETEVKRLTRYIVYTRKEGGFFYLGKAGSLRFGSTSTLSLPVSPKFKKQLLGE